MSLSNRYWGSFAITAGICAALNIYQYTTSPLGSASSTSQKFVVFQRSYLIVFLLAMFSDWLQGPYVYELYDSYGFSQVQIAELFVCGFGSSMIVGTFVGGLADKMGRKFMCVMYCACYIAACCTKMVPEYWTLMLGRFLSGVATSLLFSVFESWMVCEHHKQGFDSSWISDTFAYATFGNGLVAVGAGLVANSAAESYGYVAPFLVALIPLTIVAIFVMWNWNENYGNQNMSMCSSLQKGFDLVRRDSRIAALGLAQSCFEGAMYTFVFMWTPALKSIQEIESEKAVEKDPSAAGGERTSDYLGLIFAVFMIAVMIGSSLFKFLSSRREYLYKIPLLLHGLATFSMAATSMFLERKDVVYLMFLLFEVTVGLFYPSYGVIKSEKIPEDIRSAVMNIFRMPLNAFVVFLLLKIKTLSSEAVFQICTVTHLLALVCYSYFYFMSRTAGPSQSSKLEGKSSIPYGRHSSELELHIRESETV